LSYFWRNGSSSSLLLRFIFAKNNANPHFAVKFSPYFEKDAVWS
jgi:hypothetical protein